MSSLTRVRWEPVPRNRKWPGVCQQHLVALIGCDRLLHLINDQHHIAAALIHDFRERLSECGATSFAELIELKPETEAHPTQIKAFHLTQPCEQR
ncbi:MAG: hypothetical protein ACON4T_09465 [Synechococcus sp.]